MHPSDTYAQPTQLFAAGAPLAAHTQLALWTDLMAPAWRLLHVSLGFVLGLTLTRSLSPRGISL